MLMSIRVKVLKAITWIAGIGAVLSGCCLDSESYIPVIVLMVCASWLLLMTLANMEV